MKKTPISKVTQALVLGVKNGKPAEVKIKIAQDVTYIIFQRNNQSKKFNQDRRQNIKSTI